MSLLDDLASEFVGMDVELFDGSCPECVTSSHDHGLAVALDPVGDFRDGCGLSGSVDTDEHDDRGAVLLGEPLVEVEFVDLQDVPDGIFEGHLDDLFQTVGTVVLLTHEVLLDAGFDFFHDGVCDIRLEKYDLQFIENLIEGILFDLLTGISDDVIRIHRVFGFEFFLFFELQHLLAGEFGLLRSLRGFGLTETEK